MPMTSMRIETRLADIISAATLYGPLSAELEKQRRDFIATWPKRTTQYYHAFADGFWRRCIADLYRRHLVFGGYIGDTFYSTHRNRPDYYETNGIGPCEYADDGKVKRRGHYWSHNLRPFFVDSKD